MSRRQWFPNAANASPGMLYGQFGFITTNIGTDPVLSTAFGLGGQVGADTAGTGAANSGPSFIKSITKTANNGEFLVTMADGYRKLWYLDATLLGPAAGPAGGDWAQACAPVNEGAGHTTPVTFLVTTLNASNVPVETAGRIVMVSIAAKDSGVGA